MLYDYRQEVINGASQFLFFLYMQEDITKEVRFHETCNALEIPKNDQKDIFHKLWVHDKTIDARQETLKETLVKINKRGIEDMDALEDYHFQETGKLLIPNDITMGIKETLEKLFQLHKNQNSLTILWEKEIARTLPDNYITALEIMIDKNVLKRKSDPKHKITYLNIDVIDTNSYEEALKLLEEKNKPSKTADMIIEKVENSQLFKDSPVSNSTVSHSQTINPQPEKQKEKKWWQKWLDEFAKNAIQYSVTAAFTFSIGLISGKSCNRADSQTQSKTTIQKSGQDTTSNKNINSLDTFQHKR